jgi:hypothetical protein
VVSHAHDYSVQKIGERQRPLPAKWREEGRFAPDERVSVVITPERPQASESPKSFIGAGKGLFATAGDINAYIRRHRDAWKS